MAASHTFLDYTQRFPGLPGIIVPQTVYTGANPFVPLQPIVFYEQGRVGVGIETVLQQNFGTLDRAGEGVPFNATRISCRILVRSPIPSFEWTTLKPDLTVAWLRNVDQGRSRSRCRRSFDNGSPRVYRGQRYQGFYGGA